MKFNCENQNQNQNENHIEVGKMSKTIRFFSLLTIIIFSIYLIHTTVIKAGTDKKLICQNLLKEKKFHLNNQIKDIVKTKDKLIRRITPKSSSNEDFEDVKFNKIIFNEESVIPDVDTINHLIDVLEEDKHIISSLNILNKEDEFFDL